MGLALFAVNALYQRSFVMTHRDRAGDATGQWAGRRGAAGDVGQRQGFPTPSGGSPARPEAASPMLSDWGFRTASPVACDAPHRRTLRSWLKTLGSRLYESLLRTFGIRSAGEMSTPNSAHQITTLG